MDDPLKIGTVEWRVLQLERAREDHEMRLRFCERGSARIDEVADDVKDVKRKQDHFEEVQYRNLYGFIFTGLTVVGTFLLEFFLKR